MGRSMRYHAIVPFHTRSFGTGINGEAMRIANGRPQGQAGFGHSSQNRNLTDENVKISGKPQNLALIIEIGQEYVDYSKHAALPEA